MSEVWRDGTIELHRGDCRAIMPTLDRLADVIIADPPYAETNLSWDKTVAGWLPIARAALKPHGSLWLFGSLRSFLRIQPELVGWRFVQEVIWEKHNGSSLAADRFRRVHEQVMHLVPAGAKWTEVYHRVPTTPDATKRTVRFRGKSGHHQRERGASHYRSEDGGPRQTRSVIRCRSEHGRALHPTQKPLGILRPLIAYSCPPGGLVVDPFSGVGGSLLIARELGLSGIGIENDPSFFRATIARFDQHTLDLSGRP